MFWPIKVWNITNFFFNQKPIFPIHLIPIRQIIKFLLNWSSETGVAETLSSMLVIQKCT
jgi:hypothetical protein